MPSTTGAYADADASPVGNLGPSFPRQFAPGGDDMEDLQAIVGGFDALMRLDAEPLPHEEFDWTSVEPRDVAFVGLVLTLVDDCCEQMLDDEYRTIARRILARVAARDPRVLRRSDKTDRCAAGLVWLAGRGSGGFGRRAGWPRTSQLWHWFGVANCSDRGRALRSAAGLFPDGDLIRYDFSDEIALGDAGLLHSRYRTTLVRQRDFRVQSAAERERHSPVVTVDGDRLVVAAESIAVLGAAKSLPVDGERLGVCIVLGADLDSATVYDLSIPDAHKLVSCVQAALADPPPRRDL